MEYGLIGERLPHSFSKEIHSKIADYDYSLKELKPEELRDFILSKNYKGMNVTIPYKQAVIDCLDEISDEAKAIGAVNTVVNDGGTLRGYNTDFFGMKALIERAGIDLRYKKVLILGTGGTSKTARAVCERLSAARIYRVSRTKREDALSFEDVYRDHTDADVIINTTPAGMYPDIFSCPIELERFESLSGVIDAVYNPLRTKLVQGAQNRGVPAEGGLYMLVAQAVAASILFTGSQLEEREITDRVYKEIYFDKRNIVLTGMPSSGKSTVGKIVAERTGRGFVDTDALITERFGEIKRIFAEKGEKRFRDIETEVIRSLAEKTGLVIATGGGAVLRKENIEALRLNGGIYYLDRCVELLTPTSDRPLADEKEKIKKLYEQRKDIYCDTADYVIDGDMSANEVANEILSEEEL